MPRKPLTEEQRAKLREAAIKGGQANKAKHRDDPDYFKRIGKEGGAAGKGKPRKRKLVTTRTKAVKPSVAPVIDTLDNILKELNG